ncbi:Dabb family protein [Oerskovia turbata]
MIRHTVAFRLRHPEGSAAEAAFLSDALVLASIPGIERFERLRQTSAKNAFTFGFSMEFADAAAYAAYDAHPDHRAFVADRWVPEVEDFLEIDYEPLESR